MFKILGTLYPPPPPLASCFLSNMKLASFGRNPVISRVGLITNKGGLTLLHINPDGSGHLATAPMCPKHSTTGPLSPQQQNKNRGLSPHYQRGKACVALSDLLHQTMMQIFNLHIFSQQTCQSLLMISWRPGAQEKAQCFSASPCWQGF